jgi:NADH-quinone oxidoreductase subunit J
VSGLGLGGVDLAFAGFAALAVYCGWRVFRTDSMVRASFLLLTSFLAVAAILLLLAADYLGFALVFMMAVEMMVMALFMVMFMMNPAGLNPMRMVHQERVAAAAGVASFLGLGAVAVFAAFPLSDAPPPADPIASLGHELLGGSMLVFESAGVTLLAAMVGAVVLSSARGRHGDAHEGSRPPGLVPGGEPAGRQPEEDGGGHGHHHGHGGHS